MPTPARVWRRPISRQDDLSDNILAGFLSGPGFLFSWGPATAPSRKPCSLAQGSAQRKRRVPWSWVCILTFPLQNGVRYLSFGGGGLQFDQSRNPQQCMSRHDLGRFRGHHTESEDRIGGGETTARIARAARGIPHHISQRRNPRHASRNEYGVPEFRMTGF